MQHFGRRWSFPKSSKTLPELTPHSSRKSTKLGDERLASLLRNTHELMAFFDAGLRMIQLSAGLAADFAVDAGSNLMVWDVFPDFADPVLLDQLRRFAPGDSPLLLAMTHPVTRLPMTAQLFSAADGIGIIARSNAGEQQRLQQQEADQLLHLASHDPLTGLQNRRLFSDRLEKALADGAGVRMGAALLQIDLDEFKTVNDTLGHGAGDILLRLAARRIESSLRSGEHGFRYAGDEFAVIQGPGAEQPQAAERLAERIIEKLKAPFEVNGIAVFIGASIGIAFGVEHGTSSEQLMKAADIALYAAKSDGRGRARVFNNSMLLMLEHRENLRRNLRQALARGELFLEYQPLIRYPNSIVGFEALVRWQHPEIGIIPPGIFIPIAEADGLMDEIGRFVLENACREALRWPPSVNITVNLSPAQFRSGFLTDTVAQIIDAVGIRPDRLELEITETVLLEKTTDNLDILNTLSLLGIRVSLDDFGTSYSSLSYLKNFPFDSLKIDQYFVQDLETDAKSQTIVQSVIGLGHGLGMTVTAEGVETEGQAAWLTERGCDRLQGFWLGRPMSAEAALEFIDKAAPGIDPEPFRQRAGAPAISRGHH